ncbi:MAG: 50S ribosomal protein L15 [Elusimicrobia bacterium GWA2_69_24]|nr:MAG: 50S ribosomal protein L15 [Elusimicrobia bacterium GWA2_69_24]HBL15698.1 50S ribosomal protein L15 [Elusimicrobiota bacterium]
MTAVKTLSLNTLSPKPGARRRHKRVGCGEGSGHGKTSTRGQKGQGARSGGKRMSGFSGGQVPLFMRFPKRGFRNTAFRTSFQVVHLDDLARVFKNTNEVSLESLRVHGLIKGRQPVKVLGDGALEKPLKIQAHAFSKSAQEKIAKAGGSVEILSRRGA